MGRAAENLHRQRRLNSARALFQKPNVLLFRLANAAKSGAEADAYPVLRFVVRIFNSGVIERQLCRRDRELGVAIKSLQTMRREKFFRVPVANFAGDADTERAHVETGNWTDAGFLGENAFPKHIDALTDASDRTQAGDDDAPSTHAATRFAVVST